MTLFACKPQEVRTYSYCLVIGEATRVDNSWMVDCIDGAPVIFPRVVKEGEQVYFDPYTVDDSTVTHGYIHSIAEVVR